MKKILAILLALVMIFCFVGCVEMVSEKPIDTEYISAYDAVETVYEYKYDWLNGEFKYLPEFKQVHHDEEYKVQYEKLWANGETTTYWKVVNKTEYENALKEMVGNNNELF